MSMLRRLAPEIVLLAAAAAAMGVHLFWKKRGTRAAGFVSLGGFAAAGLAVVLTAPSPTALFGGHLTVDPFALFLKAVVLASGALAVLLSFRFFDVEGQEPGEVYYLTILMTVGLAAAVSATDLVTAYVAFELFAIPSYVLAGVFKKERRSSEAGIKYFFLGTLSSAVMLLGLALTFGLTGETNFASAARMMAAADGRIVAIAMVLVFSGLFFKAAFVPFHMWAPDVYEGAPTPLVVFLSTAPKVAVFALLIRLMTGPFGGAVVPWTRLLQALAVLTMLWGNLAALTQKSVKRMMAYSSIAQAGYIAIGLAAWGEGGRTAVLFYLPVYVLMNAAAFGIILLADGGGRFDESLDGLKGLAGRAPLAAAALIVVLLSLTGIPPTAGFMGKYFLFAAAVDKGFYALAVAGALNSAISLFYYFRVGRAAFMESGPAGGAGGEAGNRPSVLVTAVLAACALALLVLGLFPSLAADPASLAVLAPLG